MTLVTIFGKSYEWRNIQSPFIGPIELSVTVRESHDQTADITDVPIENGSNISDHRHVKAPTLSLDGIISDAATTSTAEIDGRGRVVRRPNPKINSGLTAEEAYTDLVRLFNTAATFEVLTNVQLYKNMHFVRLSRERDKSTDSTVAFTAELRQIETVTSATASAPVAATKADKPKVAKTEKKGKQETRQTSKQNESTAHEVVYGGLFQ